MYTEKQLHSSIGYRPPNEFEQLLMKNQKSTVRCQSVLIQFVQPQGIPKQVRASNITDPLAFPLKIRFYDSSLVGISKDSHLAALSWF